MGQLSHSFLEMSSSLWLVPQVRRLTSHLHSNISVFNFLYIHDIDAFLPNKLVDIVMSKPQKGYTSVPESLQQWFELIELTPEDTAYQLILKCKIYVEIYYSLVHLIRK